METTMKKLLLIFFTLYSIPAHSTDIYRSGNEKYIAHDTCEAHVVTCKSPSRRLFKQNQIKIKQFIGLYNKTTINKHLTRVVICRDLRINGHKWVRGTYNIKTKTVFVEVDRQTDDTEYVFHHEFSSVLLLKNKNFLKIKKHWLSLNKNSYSGSWGPSSNTNWNSENKNLRTKGFLFPYSTTSFENDFNVMAAFYKSRMLKYRLYKASKKYKLIGGKYKIIKKFFSEL